MRGHGDEHAAGTVSRPHGRVVVVQGLSRSSTWVVMAAFNEGRVIRSVVRELVAEGWSVVVTDDGSQDDTFEQASGPGVVVLRHVLNLGQGAALQTGIDYAVLQGAAHIVTFDADRQHDAAAIPRLLEALADADIALGSRFLGHVEGARRPRRALLQLAVIVSNVLIGIKLTDAHCGLRAFRASAAPALRMTQERMAHASELLRKVARSGLRVVEVPVTIRYSNYSTAKGQRGVEAVRIMFDYLFRG
ncbi:MAG: glycosyltransferase family 2 protein [Candidatus Rokuibacteriota bacterium]